jgi:lipopolysaccharide transport system ATP-binding protein
MSSNVAIKVENIYKSYQIYEKPIDRILQILSFGKRQLYKEFPALKNISFEIKKGETIGIIGRNGSGKSTLLQLICGTLTPTSGQITVNGRVAALLELGAGFNPEFTGKENVYMNAAILGLNKAQTDAIYPAIVEFAEIGDFIHRPVKTYSSGMFTRLAFAVSINVEPDILIIDEALAVGDVKFQAKCFRKFEELKAKNKTILFVTHSTDQIVRHCSSAILLNRGQILQQGEPRSVVNRYLDLMFGSQREEIEEEIISEPQQQSISTNNLNKEIAEKLADHFTDRQGYNKNEYRWGNSGAEITDYLICSEGRTDVNQLTSNTPIDIYLRVKFNQNVRSPIYGLMIKSPDGVLIYGNNSRDCDGRHEFISQQKGDIQIVKFSLAPNLAQGDYFISLGVAEENEGIVVPLDRRYDSIHLTYSNIGNAAGLVDMKLKFQPFVTKDLSGEK